MKTHAPPADASERNIHIHRACATSTTARRNKYDDFFLSQARTLILLRFKYTLANDVPHCFIPPPMPYSACMLHVPLRQRLISATAIHCKRIHTQTPIARSAFSHFPRPCLCAVVCRTVCFAFVCVCVFGCVCLCVFRLLSTRQHIHA